jgi:hypothetical protein
MYRTLGDAVATGTARDLAEQLVAWHDAMVNHERAAKLRPLVCGDDCPHGQAGMLWAEALDVFGEDACKLVFLRKHGEGLMRPVVRISAEARA